jgi:hypothetical protein
MKIRNLLCTGVLLLVGGLLAPAWAATLYVAPPPTGSDANPGTVGSPKATVQAAATIAIANNAAAVSTTILINPGTYRESVLLAFTGTETASPIIFQAVTDGTAIISGSDIYTGWTDIGGGIFSHAWTNDWGLAPYPPGWSGFVTLPDIVRRREMVFVNGVQLTQVLTLGELTIGEFFADETGNLLKIFPPAGTNMGTAVVEVAIRPAPFLAEGKSFVTLKGLTFQHGNAALQGAAVTFNNCADITVEDSFFDWNNWMGITFSGTTRITVRGGHANHNGATGSGGYQVKSSLFDEWETSYNNWRGGSSLETSEWAIAGLKHLLVHDTTYRRLRAIGNQSWGFWIDTAAVNVTIEESEFSSNLLDGMFLEAIQGPIQLTHNVFATNTRDGLLLGNVAQGTLQSNILRGNAGTQLRLGGSSGTRAVTNWETLVVSNVWSENWTWLRNQFSGSGAALLFITTLTSPPEPWAAFQSTLSSNYNTWSHPTVRESWIVPGGAHVALPAWQTLTGQDLTSTFRKRN